MHNNKIGNVDVFYTDTKSQSGRTKKPTQTFSNPQLNTECVISLMRFTEITSINRCSYTNGDVIFEYGRGVCDENKNEAFIIIDKQIYHADSLMMWLQKQHVIPHTRKKAPTELITKITTLCKENTPRNRILKLFRTCLGME